MRATEFQRLLTDTFGANAKWIAHSHVLSMRGKTAEELIEQGVDLAKIWEELCDDFEIPESQRLGKDLPGW